MIPQDPIRVTRAAFIAERADGTRVLYEYEPGSITLEMEHDYEQVFMGGIARPLPSIAPTLTVRGLMRHGVEFHGDMPTAGQDEITNRHELEPGRHQITRGTHAG